MLGLVSVVISTYNRFDDLVRAIQSVRDQTYKHIEIIVVNDCSTQEEYSQSLGDDILRIDLPTSTKSMFGFPCPGYVRTVGIKRATGKYVAFLDDDDVWFPNKLELQLEALNTSGCKMSTTDAYWDFGLYDSTKKYRLFYSEIFFNEIKSIHRTHNSKLLDNGFPAIWTRDIVEPHNPCMTSSVIVEKELLDRIGYMKFVPIGKEDWDCWKNILTHTNSVFIAKPLVYYTRRA